MYLVIIDFISAVIQSFSHFSIDVSNSSRLELSANAVFNFVVLWMSYNCFRNIANNFPSSNVVDSCFKLKSYLKYIALFYVFAMVKGINLASILHLLVVIELFKMCDHIAVLLKDYSVKKSIKIIKKIFLIVPFLFFVFLGIFFGKLTDMLGVVAVVEFISISSMCFVYFGIQASLIYTLHKVSKLLMDN